MVPVRQPQAQGECTRNFSSEPLLLEVSAIQEATSNVPFGNFGQFRF